MNAAPDELPVQKKWPWTRWLMLVALVFIAHVALIFIFGAYEPTPVRRVENVPSLQLVGKSSGEWLGLNNSTLFALPNLNGFAGPMLTALPPLPLHHQDWSEQPRWLTATDSLTVAELGSTFNRFMQTNRFAKFPLEFQLPPPLTAPVLPIQALDQNSTLQIKGEIAGRHLLNPMKLQSWPYADVIAPSKVQVLVNAAGNVVSTVLLPSRNFLEAPVVQDADADQRALNLARAARFAPLSPNAASIEANSTTHLAIGRLVFNWQTTPATATNAQ